MPKIVQDMVKKRSAPKPKTKEVPLGVTFSSKPERIPFAVSTGENKSKYTVWILASLSALFLFFSISLYFARAEVKISPKFAEVDLKKTFSASKNAPEGKLAFDVIILSNEETKLVPATDTKEVAKKAAGAVVIYNAYGKTPQKLVVNTRLETPAGKIYRIDNDVIVPGYATKSGQIIPGSIEVKMHADAAGADYNSAPADFTIPGFKGDQRYSKFYARSKGDITGGFTGLSPVIEAEARDKAEQESSAALRAKLIRQAASELPPGFILWEEGAVIKIAEAVESASGDKSVLVKVSGALSGIIFDKNILSAEIAKASVSGYDGNEVLIPDLSALKFSLKNKDSIDIEKVKDVSFDLSGSAKIIYAIDQNKLASELAGIKKKFFTAVMANYKNVDSASVVVRPFWRGSIPKDPKRIKIVNSQL